MKVIFAVISAVLMFFSAETVLAQNTIYVPDNYSTIQQAADAANEGDMIIVRSGCYSENIKVGKSDLTVKSADGPRGAIISSADPAASVFELNGRRVTLSGFTIKGAATASGISINYNSTDDKIENNVFEDNQYGIYISLFSNLSEITGNIFKETNDYGLYLQEAFDSGSGTVRKSSANTIYLNDFYCKLLPGYNGWPYYNHWKTAEATDYKYEDGYHRNHLGNFYVFYAGSDGNNDGIGEEPQALNGEADNFPLVKPSSSYEVLTEEPEWTFAVLADLHVGWGIPDYGEPGYGQSDNEPGQDYYLTERLNRAVEWINGHAASDNIKFVAILGDITDTAEYSEFLKAREILNQLAIPYIPIIGNHDIVPYISNPNWDPDTRTIGTIKAGIGKTWENGESFGDQIFEEVFWQDNIANTQKINNLFENFNKQPFANQFYENYSFTYNNIKFISLDFASRVVDTQLSLPTNATVPVDTLAWLNDQLKDCDGKQTILMTHYPLRDIAGGFLIGMFPFVEDQILNSNCLLTNLAGHTHVNKEQLWKNKYNVFETESLSQIPFWFYKNQNKFLRLVRVQNDNDTQEIKVDNFATGFSSSIDPYITIFPGVIGVNMPINFHAGVKNRNKSEIESYTWKFDDDDPYTTMNSDVVKWISEQGVRTVELTVNDVYGNSETVNWHFEVKEDTRLGRKMVISNGTAIPVLYTGIDLRDDKYAQNTNEWVSITKDGVKLIGMVNTHFELADFDIDISDMSADIDFDQNKSVMHMDNWPSVIETRKILYIPSSGRGEVYICPGSKSLEDVNKNCVGITTLGVGETKNGMSLNTISYEGQDYYQVIGIIGTGGGEWSDEQENPNSNLEEQIEITKLVYDGTDILEKAASDMGDKHLPLLLSEIKQVKINLTDYLPQIKRLFQPLQKKTLEYKLKFLESIGNEWQGKKIRVWFNFEANQ